MKIARTETQETEVEIIEDIICNKCGETCRLWEDGQFGGLIENKYTGGYGSILGDMTTYTYSICEKCMKELFDTFKIPVSVGGE